MKDGKQGADFVLHPPGIHQACTTVFQITFELFQAWLL
tara:strand:- start:916 stop:1029 length:114 start_codon:yes stop_codon:yes gene_type:complete